MMKLTIYRLRHLKPLLFLRRGRLRAFCAFLAEVCPGLKNARDGCDCQGYSLDLLILLWRIGDGGRAEGEEGKKGCRRRIVGRELGF